MGTAFPRVPPWNHPAPTWRCIFVFSRQTTSLQLVCGTFDTMRVVARSTSWRVRWHSSQRAATRMRKRRDAGRRAATILPRFGHLHVVADRHQKLIAPFLRTHSPGGLKGPTTLDPRADSGTTSPRHETVDCGSRGRISSRTLCTLYQG